MPISFSLYKYVGSYSWETYSKMYITVLFTVHIGNCASKGMEILYVHKRTKA